MKTCGSLTSASMEQNPNKENEGPRRPLWQWVILYLVPALLVYGIVFYGLPLLKTSPEASQSAPPSSTQVVTYIDSGFSPDTMTSTRRKAAASQAPLILAQTFSPAGRGPSSLISPVPGATTTI